MLATANTAKIRERFWKNEGEWTEGQELEIDQSLAVSVACMAIYRPTPGSKGRTCKLCVLTRWDFNFCVCSSPLREDWLEIERVSIKASCNSYSPSQDVIS